MIRYLGWQAAERIQVAVAARIVIITRSSAGVECLTKQGHLRVSVAIRRRCQLIAATRVLMAASRERGLCALYPSDIEAARLLLATLGVSVEDLVDAAPAEAAKMPTLRAYIAQVEDAVPPAALRVRRRAGVRRPHRQVRCRNHLDLRDG